MFKFIANIIHAQRNAALLATASNELASLATKASKIVSQATGGVLADVEKGVGAICAEISLSRSRVYKIGLDVGADAKAKELSGDLLHSMHEVERKVLVTLHHDFGRPLADVASYTELALNDVRTLAKGLVIKGLAYFGPFTDDEGRPCGSGYTLTVAGEELKTRALAADVVASAAVAESIVA